VSSFFLASHPRRDYHEKNVGSFFATEFVSGEWPMVMGFDTDVKFEGVVYHVQTEARKGTAIETTVYVRGATIHCLKTDCQDLMSSPDYTEPLLRQRFEDQHRQVIGRIRAGEIRAQRITGPSSGGKLD
jgi:hypothetical protein